jgi:hypothetical protein
MRRKITLSIALALSIALVSLTGSELTATAQRRVGRVVDTGLVMLGPNQTLRITALNKGPEASTIRFRTTQYSQTVCSNGVCRHTAATPNISGPLTVAPGEAVSIDAMSSSSGVRMVAAPDGQDYDNWTYLMAVIDVNSGKVVAYVGPLQQEMQRENR